MNKEGRWAAVRRGCGFDAFPSSDPARLYGVTTAALNQAVKRNAVRFPKDSAFQPTPQELRDLISQTVTSTAGRGGRAAGRSREWRVASSE